MAHGSNAVMAEISWSVRLEHLPTVFGPVQRAIQHWAARNRCRTEYLLIFSAGNGVQLIELRRHRACAGSTRQSRSAVNSVPGGTSPRRREDHLPDIRSSLDGRVTGCQSSPARGSMPDNPGQQHSSCVRVAEAQDRSYDVRDLIHRPPKQYGGKERACHARFRGAPSISKYFHGVGGAGTLSMLSSVGWTGRCRRLAKDFELDDQEFRWLGETRRLPVHDAPIGAILNHCQEKQINAWRKWIQTLRAPAPFRLPMGWCASLEVPHGATLCLHRLWSRSSAPGPCRVRADERFAKRIGKRCKNLHFHAVIWCTAMGRVAQPDQPPVSSIRIRLREAAIHEPSRVRREVRVIEAVVITISAAFRRSAQWRWASWPRWTSPARARRIHTTCGLGFPGASSFHASVARSGSSPA